jgi:hypothetical protein
MKILPDISAQWQSAEADELEFSLLSLTATSEPVGHEEIEKMRRTREDWGPFIAHMIELHSQKGDLKDKMG